MFPSRDAISADRIGTPQNKQGQSGPPMRDAAVFVSFSLFELGMPSSSKSSARQRANFEIVKRTTSGEAGIHISCRTSDGVTAPLSRV